MHCCVLYTIRDIITELWFCDLGHFAQIQVCPECRHAADTKCENHWIRWSPVPLAFSWWSTSFMPHLFCMFPAPFSVIRKLNQCAVRLVQTGTPAVCDRVVGGCCQSLHSLLFFSMPGYILGRSSEPDWPRTQHASYYLFCPTSSWQRVTCARSATSLCSWGAVMRARVCHVLFTVKKRKKKNCVRPKLKKHAEAVTH